MRITAFRWCCVMLVCTSVLINAFAAEAPNAPAPPVPTTKTNPKDGAEMVLVPAGEFLMGSTDADPKAYPWEKPQRKVFLDAYYIYKNNVTVAQYKKFCDATGRRMPSSPVLVTDTLPIVNVNWADATAYAQWALAALPTEAQWEKAARGTDGRLYPWGNAWDATKCAHSVEQGAVSHIVANGSYPTGASPYGVLDMAGNVNNWCADWYHERYYQTAPAKNPTGPVTGTDRVARGCPWNAINAFEFRAAYRTYRNPAIIFSNMSFRCVVAVPAVTPTPPGR